MEDIMKEREMPVLCPCPVCKLQVHRENNANKLVYIFVCIGCGHRFKYQNGKFCRTNGHIEAVNYLCGI